MAADDIHKTVITTHFGVYKSLHTLFGLRNPVQNFQRFIAHVFRGINFIHAYVDDCSITCTNRESHLQNLDLVYERLQKHTIIVNIQKCQIGTDSLDIFGHFILKVSSQLCEDYNRKRVMSAHNDNCFVH